MNRTGFDILSSGTERRGVLIIAELGTGHLGDAGKAAELIAAAIGSGADCVKFQHVYADEIIHPATGLVPLPGGPTPLYETFRSLETGPDFLSRCKEIVESAGAAFLCSPFGIRSARELRDMGASAMKIASPELNYIQLLEEVASYGLPTILSGGVSRLADIERALEAFSGTGSPTALLHCVTSYPAPESEYNLRLLPSLAALFGVPIGVSDHSVDPELVPAVAVAQGARVVEKHFCLSKGDSGLDDPIALNPEDFARMARAVRRASELVSEGGADGALRSLKEDFGEGRVEAALGDGRKRLAPSEAANYSRTNRSIHARRPIARGERLDERNLCVVRTEKVLRPGLEPVYLPVVDGRLAARDIPDGEGVVWADVGGR
ncbi:MAG: N-acetylneuraminate synthase family protein [Spirochaetes bacterium]|nr:N-acetylneuraminate synthase family protein [Spirochaetota bacterium]MBU1079586.1 N-acetylneuraminate synthase family protein [Spirochaetota bacterium]